MTKSPHQVYSEREAEFIELLPEDFSYKGCGFSTLTYHNKQTLHAVIDAMIEREGKGLEIEPVGDDEVYYDKAKQDTINYLKEFKSKLKDK